MAKKSKKINSRPRPNSHPDAPITDISRQEMLKRQAKRQMQNNPRPSQSSNTQARPPQSSSTQARRPQSSNIQARRPQGSNTQARPPQRPNTQASSPPRAPLFDQMSAVEPRKITNPYKSVNPNEIFFDDTPQTSPVEKPLTKKEKKAARRVQKRNNEEEPIRKITRAQARKRRNRRRFLAVFLTLLVLIVGFVLSVTVLFKISAYELDGDSPYNVQDLSIAFAHPVGENIFAFKISDAQAAMEKVLPYAETVTVRRRLPGTIVFKVQAAVESYYIQVSDTFVILSQNLKILRTDTKAPNDLIKIEGITSQSVTPGDELTLESEGKLIALTKLLTALETESFAPITMVDITSELEMSVLYDNRAKIILGTQSDLHDKFAIAKTVMEEHIGKDERGVLDVSHQNENEHRSGVWRAGKF